LRHFVLHGTRLHFEIRALQESRIPRFFDPKRVTDRLSRNAGKTPEERIISFTSRRKTEITEFKLYFGHFVTLCLYVYACNTGLFGTPVHSHGLKAYLLPCHVSTPDDTTGVQKSLPLCVYAHKHKWYSD